MTVEHVQRSRIRTFGPSPPPPPNLLDTYALHNQLRTAHVIVANDQYDKRMINSKWVAGPNEVFYRSMGRNGDVYERHIRPGRYRVIHQIEIDVCPVRDGWLSALVTEAGMMLRTSAVISGARVEGPLVCGAEDYTCVSSETHPDYIRQHINGNAMYRIGDTLQNLIDDTISLYPDWPFDLAVYLTANQTNSLHLLRYTNFIFNRVVPVAAIYALNPHIYDSHTYLVHTPFEYKRDTSLAAAKATLTTGYPVVVIAACQEIHPQILLNLQISIQRQGVSNVIWVTEKGDRATLEDVMHLKPVAFAESEDMRCLTGFGQCMAPLDVVGDLIENGFDVFAMNGDAVILANLSHRLSRLEQNAIHFASGAVQSYGHFLQGETNPRYRFTSNAFYVAASMREEWHRVAAEWRDNVSRPQFAHPDFVISAGANCTTIASCSWKDVPIRLLPPQSYALSANVVKLWPEKDSLADAAVLIGISSDSVADAADNTTRAMRLDTARFRMQAVYQWHLTRTGACCSSVLTADDVQVTEDAETVRNFVDLVLQMSETARKKRVSCVVPPGIVDIRTGERVGFDTVFDPSTAFGATHIFPSLTHVPFCSRMQQPAVLNLTLDSASGRQRQPWPLHAFSKEVRAAFSTIGESRYLADYVCIDDAARTSAEAALLILRESAASTLALPSHEHVYLAGKWRVVDKHARKQMPGVLTLLSPSLYPDAMPPRAFYNSFGLRAHYPRLGEDLVMDVLDFLVCNRTNKIARPAAAQMSLDEIYAGIFEHVSPEVLSEDLGLTELFGATDVSKPFLIPLDTVENNGFSNLVNAAQVLAYVSSRAHMAATMVPLSSKHLVHAQIAWSAVIANVTGVYATFPSLRPPLWAILRHPSLIIEVMDGYMLSAGRAKLWSHAPLCDHAGTPNCITRDNPAHVAARALHSPLAFKPLHVAGDDAQLENMKLMGCDAVSGKEQPYLGLAESQLSSVFDAARMNGRDVVFRPFRAFNFQNSNADHVSFAKSWRRAFRFSEYVHRQAKLMRAHLSPDFTCYHARVADEFIAQHRNMPIFNKMTVYSMLSRSVELHEMARRTESAPGVYISTDTHDPIENIIGRSTPAVMTCHAHGCRNVSGDVVWGAVERVVCASAKDFFGNIYSTFTLSVCSLRRDQVCKDLFNQTLADGRLLF